MHSAAYVLDAFFRPRRLRPISTLKRDSANDITITHSAAYVLKRDSANDITITQMFITLAIMLEVY